MSTNKLEPVFPPYQKELTDEDIEKLKLLHAQVDGANKELLGLMIEAYESFDVSITVTAEYSNQPTKTNI